MRIEREIEIKECRGVAASTMLSKGMKDNKGKNSPCITETNRPMEQRSIDYWKAAQLSVTVISATWTSGQGK
jgi:hypothetical protein